ncbi:glycoside hydrolase/deacetylase [Bimuria novae-zelandiae CBS 107.79]|uniref:Glycoside hydrolase/deacetylase n=1 Tax=Bimuria novae-zelandiae CBS 107.79 TaxID=1447943 RepID=A0A6A5VG66_9PLEO|nr:glycoside hydrolase/deacetylase [Bimuria novae-zelandiae CBS 107.79]
MRFSTAIATVAAVAPIVSAHDAPGLPKIGGLHMRDLKARNLMDSLKIRAAELAHAHERSLKPRQGGTDGQCGPGFGSCAAGYCCSGAGWCGNTDDYCYAPGCNYQYGPGCPDNAIPAGANTSSVSRTKLGSILYGGAGIYECTVPGTVALTFDDGPFDNYTEHVLDLFEQYNARGTFFITGNNINKGEIDTTASHTATIKRMAAEGHQIASHTWTHQDLSAISETDRKAQMIKNEMAIRNIVGYFPTYMRPPYSSCTTASGCEKTMADLGYHVIYFDVDTDDYNQLEDTQIQNAKDNFRGNITQGGATPAQDEWLAIAHDIHPQTAYNLTAYVLSTLTTLGYKAVTVGECLNDPKANWYRSSTGNIPSGTATSAAPTASSTNKVSTDGTCAGTPGFTCQGSTFGNCCSQYGWCGSTTDHCGTGCNKSFGTCT